MSSLKEKNGIWFVYDGDCPICTHAAEALRIKKDYGQLYTLNARGFEADPLIEEINQRGLDLDEGMVIYANDTFYHGKEALNFMAKYGEVTNSFMAVFKGLFWSTTISILVYPWLRGARNWLLRRKNVHRIDNLQLKNEPIFKAIFGESWDDLPPVLKKHYSNRPYTQDETLVKGELDVICKPPLKWLSPLMKLLGQIPTYNETNVSVTVHFQSDLNTKAFHFNRIFNFSKGKPYKFQSRMIQIKGDEVIEIMRFGLGWKMSYSWDGEKVVLSHRGYALSLFGHLVPLPITILMGAGYAEERPVDDNTFEMETHIMHPWWGKIYEYKGRFEVLN
jgi:hypothetical protein